MKFTRVPASFFPTTLILIDDNQRFLKNISLQFDEQLSYKIFDNTEEALHCLNAMPKVQSLLSKHVVGDVERNSYASNLYSINLDLSSIHKEVYNKDRFKTVSTIVVDYAMPSMNGLQFCQQLKDNQIKKIMLTGEADYQLAVQAFNERIIDGFILKSESGLSQKLNKAIFEIQKKYFLDLTEGIENTLTNEPEYCLNDPKAVEIFNTICEENGIVEHYLLDTSGSALLLDAFGNPSWFIIKSDPELKMYAEFAEDDKVSPILCKQLGSGEKIPFFPAMINNPNWDPYLYPAKRIEGKETYYYALLKNIKNEKLLTHKILPYEKYLNDNVEMVKEACCL